jgi:hypothetical protein
MKKILNWIGNLSGWWLFAAIFLLTGWMLTSFIGALDIVNQQFNDAEPIEKGLYAIAFSIFVHGLFSSK